MRFNTLINKYKDNDGNLKYDNGREIIGIYRQALQNPIELDFKALSKELYTALIPIELKNYNEIIIIPHAYLGLLIRLYFRDSNVHFNWKISDEHLPKRRY